MEKEFNRCKFYIDEIKDQFELSKSKNLDFLIMMRYFVKLNSYLKSNVLNIKEKNDLYNYFYNLCKENKELISIGNVYFDRVLIPLEYKFYPLGEKSIEFPVVTEKMITVMNKKNKVFFMNNFTLDTVFESINVYIPSGYRNVKNIESFTLEIEEGR